MRNETASLFDQIRQRPFPHLFPFRRHFDDVPGISVHGLDPHIVVHLLFKEGCLGQHLGLISKEERVEARQPGQHEEHKPAQGKILKKLKCRCAARREGRLLHLRLIVAQTRERALAPHGVREAQLHKVW